MMRICRRPCGGTAAETVVSTKCPNISTCIFTNQQYLITELIVSSSFIKINTACLRAAASSQPELSLMLALLMAAQLLLDTPVGNLYGTSPNISQISLLAGLECSEHRVWGMEHGASPNLHQEPTEAPWGWLWSPRAVTSLLHNTQPVLLHPSTAQSGIDPTGQWEQDPVVGQGLSTYLCCR